MRISQIIKAAVPGASDSFCEYILWSRTPFPFITVSAKDIYKAAMGANRAIKNNIRLCDFCKNKAVDKGYTCQKCSDTSHQVRLEDTK